MIIKKKCIMDELNVSVFANCSCKIEKKSGFLCQNRQKNLDRLMQML